MNGVLTVGVMDRRRFLLVALALVLAVQTGCVASERFLQDSEACARQQSTGAIKLTYAQCMRLHGHWMPLDLGSLSSTIGVR